MTEPTLMNMNFSNGHRAVIAGLLVLGGCIMCEMGCSNDYKIVGVNSSEPGVIEVFIKPDDADSMIVIAGDTVKPTNTNSDSLPITISKGTVFRGADYAVLYGNLKAYLEVNATYNLISKQGNVYQTLLVFQSYLPPATYDSLSFVLSASYMHMGFYQVPLAPLQESSDFVSFAQPFQIAQGETTAVILKLKPFASLTRVGDSYRYSWIFDSVQVKMVK